MSDCGDDPPEAGVLLMSRYVTDWKAEDDLFTDWKADDV